MKDSLNRIAEYLQAEVNRMAEFNRNAAERRRFKPGPFDFTADNERRVEMQVLDLVIGALRAADR